MSISKSTKRMVTRIMDVVLVLMVVAKVIAVFYLLGLCGAYEQDALSGIEFLTKAIITLLFVIFG